MIHNCSAKLTGLQYNIKHLEVSPKANVQYSSGRPASDFLLPVPRFFPFSLGTRQDYGSKGYDCFAVGGQSHFSTVLHWASLRLTVELPDQFVAFPPRSQESGRTEHVLFVLFSVDDSV